MERANSINWDQPRQTAVKFAEASDDEELEKNTIPIAEQQFVRHDTPHPKELKARHQKLFAHKEKSEEPLCMNTNVNNKQNSVQTQRNSTTSTASNSSSDASVIVKSDSEIAEINAISEKSYSYVDSKVKSASFEVDNQSYENKHVGFTEVVDDDEDQEYDPNEEQQEKIERHNKLHRRDTPHHLKNKRINISSSKEEREKFASILAEAVKKEPEHVHSSSFGSLSGGDNESLRTVSSYSTNAPQQTVNENGPTQFVQMKVYVMKKSAGLGLSIAGGKASSPYKGDDEGIFVCRITPNGPAEAAGLQVGDKILFVNDISFEEVDHYHAVDVLKAAGSDFTLTIVREIPIDSKENYKQVVTEKPPIKQAPIKQNGNVPSSTSASSFNFNPESFDLKKQIIYTTLIRDQNGVGFSIAGGEGGVPYKEGCDGIYVSRIMEGGAADRDGKLREGDKILAIDGEDVTKAKHDKVIAKLTGLGRFIRLVVEREGTEGDEKSPKLFGLPKPYTSLYASSYMANRPSYTGSYRRPTLGSVSSLSGIGAESGFNSAPVTPTSVSPGSKPTYSIYTKLPGLRNDPSAISSSIKSSPNSSNQTSTMSASNTMPENISKSASSSLERNGNKNETFIK